MKSCDSSEWRPVTARRSSTDIVDQVMERFFAEMRPGQRLGTEGELATRFGVSRVTIRDAVRELEARGVVEVKIGAHGGIHVADRAPERLGDALAVQVHLMGVEWNEMLEAQQTLEPSVARLAAQRATATEVAKLRALIDESRAAIAEPERFAELSVRFHIEIAAAARNRILHASLAALRYVEASTHEVQTDAARAKRVVTAHEGIFDAIAEGDGELALARMTEHLLVVRRAGGTGGHACGLKVGSRLPESSTSFERATH